MKLVLGLIIYILNWIVFFIGILTSNLSLMLTTGLFIILFEIKASVENGIAMFLKELTLEIEKMIK